MFRYRPHRQEIFGEYAVLSHQIHSLDLRFMSWRYHWFPQPRSGVVLLPDDDPVRQPHVQPILQKQVQCIKSLFDAAEKIRHRYGKLYDEEELAVMRFDDVRAQSAQSAYLRFWHEIRDSKRRINVWQACRWSLHDKRRLQETTQILTTFIHEFEQFTLSSFRVGCSVPPEPSPDTVENHPDNIDSHDLPPATASRVPYLEPPALEGEWLLSSEVISFDRKQRSEFVSSPSLTSSHSNAVESTGFEIHDS